MVDGRLWIVKSVLCRNDLALMTSGQTTHRHPLTFDCRDYSSKTPKCSVISSGGLTWPYSRLVVHLVFSMLSSRKSLLSVKLFRTLALACPKSSRRKMLAAVLRLIRERGVCF